MFFSCWVVLTHTQVWDAALDGVLAPWGEGQGCPRHWEYFAEYCCMSAVWVRTWSKQGNKWEIGRVKHFSEGRSQTSLAKGIFFFPFLLLRPQAWSLALWGRHQSDCCLHVGKYLCHLPSWEHTQRVFPGGLIDKVASQQLCGRRRAGLAAVLGAGGCQQPGIVR